MKQQKGFSLFEVIIACLFTASSGLALMHMQVKARLLFRPITLQTQASFILDTLSESLYANNTKISPDLMPASFTLQQNTGSSRFTVTWHQGYEFLTRALIKAGTE